MEEKGKKTTRRGASGKTGWCGCAGAEARESESEGERHTGTQESRETVGERRQKVGEGCSLARPKVDSEIFWRKKTAMIPGMGGPNQRRPLTNSSKGCSCGKSRQPSLQTEADNMRRGRRDGGRKGDQK
jgi:hypothetical protein